MKDITLNILCHADFSGRIREKKDSVGFCSFSAEIDSLRNKYLDSTVLCDAGDSFNTNFWGGLPLVKASNINGTDVMCVGNHEFDKGYEFLKKCIDSCGFPVLCANIKEKSSGKLIYKTVPTVMIVRSGIKIGVVGLTTEYTPFMVEKSAFKPFETVSASASLKKYIPELREAGAEVIIVLTHMPFYQSDEGALSGELIDLMNSSPYADLWIGGHIPGDCAKIVNDSCILKAGFGGNSIGQALLTMDGDTHKIKARSCRIVHTSREKTVRPEISNYINSIIEPFNEYFSEKLSYAKEKWQMRLAKESKLGDFLVDALRYGGNTELAYMNATSCCGCIEAGDVTRDTITEVAGYNDKIYIGNITGSQLHELIELVYEPDRFGNNAAILISGFHFEIDHTKKSPFKVMNITLSNGEKIEKDKIYTVTTSAYMASGGNDTTKVASNIKWKELDKFYYDVVFSYAKSMDVLKVEDYKRFKEIGEPENNNAPY